MLSRIKKDLKARASSAKARILARYFKTGKGEYGHGDKFIGVTVPETREIAQKHVHTPLTVVKHLLRSKIHEERLLALHILSEQFRQASNTARKKIIDFYLANTTYVNNWDLVDSSAHQLLGEWLLDKERSLLDKLARSKQLWERRIAIIATYAFIKRNQFSDTLRIAETLLHDSHDLMHKATGWMLRELGKREQAVLERFLKKHAHKMPRTMLRYAIERFPETKRKAYLSSSQKPRKHSF